MILENNVAVRVLEKRGMERGVKIGEERGEKRGVKIGEENGFARAALAMLKKGMSQSSVADTLDQPIDWVKDLQNRQPETIV